VGNEPWKETLDERKVTYTLEADGKLIVVENVPAQSRHGISCSRRQTAIPFQESARAVNNV
jgi:hypothetical protein